jgi:hypothetical protein
MISSLLAHGANVNQQCNEASWTPLHAAMSTQDIATINEILSAQTVDVNLRDKDGDTPLHQACWMRNDIALELLLRGGHCDFMAENRRGWTALQYAIWNGWPRGTALLFAPGASTGSDELCQAIYNGCETCEVVIDTASQTRKVRTPADDGAESMSLKAFGPADFIGTIELLRSRDVRVDLNHPSISNAVTKIRSGILADNLARLNKSE